MPKKYMRNGQLVTVFKVENPEGPNRNPDLYAWVGAVASETHRTVEFGWDKDKEHNTYVLSLMFSDGFKIELRVGQYLILDEQGQWTNGEEGQFDEAGSEPTPISDTPGGQPLVDFGTAILMLKDGARVARIGWNGKVMDRNEDGRWWIRSVARQPDGRPRRRLDHRRMTITSRRFSALRIEGECMQIPAEAEWKLLGESGGQRLTPHVEAFSSWLEQFDTTFEYNLAGVEYTIPGTATRAVARCGEMLMVFIDDEDSECVAHMMMASFDVLFALEYDPNLDHVGEDL
ncbi:hypothetical protein Bpfe_031109 [Biomphalaria pfeifferi]|uniref:Uncharacterized protein n=1 Tax=Biomphalaria pfeifferi TaxID=112525 RepID=A0AAD8AN97_BIOPF|nr:hypothetical protein Bpfe_031109 [Biomphalaria pfeifferi]